MEIQNTSLSPVEILERITALDIMRWFVLCGILLININSFGLAHAYGDPTISGGSTGWNLYTWIATNMFFEGTMRCIFSLLFGVGMFILLDRMDKRHAGIKGADIYFRRLTWLLLFGVLHAYILIWSGEILFNYALIGFLVYSFRRQAPKTLVIIALVLFSIGSFWNFMKYRGKVEMLVKVEQAKVMKAEGKELDREFKGATEAWEKVQENRSPEIINAFYEGLRKGYFGVVAFNALEVFKWKTYGTYRYDVWDVLSMMLLGIALFKWNILSGDKPALFYLTLVAVGYAIGLTVNYFETTNIINQNFSYISFYETNATYDLGRVAVSMGHIGMIMLFSKLNVLHWLKYTISCIGKMALTNYLTHSLICMIVFTGVGFGMFGKLQLYELLYVVFSIWLFQLIISPIWLKYFHHGPAEWLWRRMSYLQKPPFKKSKAVENNVVEA